MRYLSIGEVLILYQRIMTESGGKMGIQSLSSLESSLSQPRMTFAGKDLYPTIVEKAAILGFSLIENHPFHDGNKRIGHAAVETFLILNSFEIDAPIAEQEQTMLEIAGGKMSLESFKIWLQNKVIPFEQK